MGLIVRRGSDVLVFDDDYCVRSLAIDSGSLRTSRKCEAGLGLRDSYVVGDILVGHLAGSFHAIDLSTLMPLWEVPELLLYPLVGDEQRVIRADEDVTCYDLKTGAVRWRRPGADFGGKAYQMGFLWRDLFCVRIGEPLLLTALDAETGKTVWRADFPVQWCQPYGDRAYGIESTGRYQILDLEAGRLVLERQLADVPGPTGRKGGLTAAPMTGHPWRDARVAVSETHAFIQRPAGQIVVLGRETGEVEQIVELDGMPIARTEPVIYENNLLLTDFNAAVYCFRGAE